LTNKYIMLVNGIIGMGGGQMYTNNKLSYMKKLGWEPYVFSGMEGQIVIPTLRKYDCLIKRLMIASPMIYSRRVVNSLIDEIVNEIGDFDEAVIESGSGHMALWGELLAKRLQCKHMVHLLDERPDVVVPKEYLDFYRFKLERRELSGIANTSLKILFRNSDEINEQNSYHLPSVCQNVVSDSEEGGDIEIPQTGITMGCIGRLGKRYVEAATAAFATVAKKHADKRFNVLFIGASDEKQHEKRIRSILGVIPNVELLMPGFMYPIPQAILNKVDVFISSAGSAGVSYRNGRPTIAIDGRDNMAIGVLGYTTTNSLYRSSEEKVDPADLLEAILFKNYLAGKTYAGKEKNVDMEILKQHIVFLKSSSREKQYFDIAAMKAAGKDKKKKAVRFILGTQGYVRFHDKGLELLAKLRKK